jgi:hypothetical protein
MADQTTIRALDRVIRELKEAAELATRVAAAVDQAHGGAMLLALVGDVPPSAPSSLAGCAQHVKELRHGLAGLIANAEQNRSAHEFNTFAETATDEELRAKFFELFGEGL